MMGLLGSMRADEKAQGPPVLWLGCLLALTIIFFWLSEPQALGNTAELIIKHGDGRVVSKKITFKKPAISGIELLRRSGLPVSIVAGSAGEAVYMIDGEGDPNGWVTANGQTYYWNYFRLVDGKWRYATTGAGLAKVKDGDSEGWLWQAYGAGGTLPPASSTPRHAEPGNSASVSKDHTDGYLGFAIIAAALLAAILFFIFGRHQPQP
jgi:hypothetical protein